jgi:hypothetical protein
MHGLFGGLSELLHIQLIDLRHEGSIGEEWELGREAIINKCKYKFKTI